MEVAGLAVWGGAQRRTKLTDEQVPFPLSAPASALPLEQGSIGLDDRHWPGNLVPFRNGWNTRNKFDLLLNHKTTAINLIREYISLLGSGGTCPANILSAKRRSC